MDLVADRTVTLRIGANVTDAVAKFKTLENASSQWIDKHNAGLQKVSAGMLGMGAALTGLAVVAVKKFADFDQAMSGVQAATMETTQNMGLLRAAALKAGADTMYTASDAANAITDLGKAGVSTADILGGGLSGSLNLAAAAQMDVAQAAEITATALNQYGLKGSDASHVSDLLAAAAGKAMGDVADMAGALKFVGPVAHQMGVSIEETAGTIAMLAQQGILGEQAGTSLRGMISSLTSPSKIASEQMHQLGIEVYDLATGKFVGLKGVADQLYSSMSGLTNAARDQAFGLIFGNEQITTARLLYQSASDAAKQSGNSIADWTAKVNASGFAAEQANIKTNNLKGDIERLGGSMDTAFIGAGEAANGPLRSLVQSTTDVVNAFSGLPSGVQQGTLAIVGGTGLVALGLGGLGKLAVGINDAKNAFKDLGISAKTAGAAAGGLGVALGVVTFAVSAWASESARAAAMTDRFAGTLDDTGKATDATKSAINELLVKGRDVGGILKFKSAADEAEKMGISLSDLTGYVLKNQDAIDRVNTAGKNYIGQSGFWGHVTQAREGDVANLTYTLDQMGLALTETQKQELQKALADEKSGASSQESAARTEQQTAAIQAQAQATEEATKALEEWRKAVSESDASFLDLGSMYDSIVKGNQDAAAAISDTAKVQAVSADQYIATLQAQVDAQSSWEQNILDISARVRDGLGYNMRSAGEQMIDELMKLGPEGAQQVQLLHDMSSEQFNKVVSLYQQKGAQAVSDFTTQVESYRPATLTPDVNLTPANQAVQNWINQNRTVKIDVGATVAHAGQRVAMAHGGILPGAPSSRDNMLIAAASGEFVVNAAATSRNRATLEAINSGVQGYANGGYVTPRYYSAPAMASPAVAPGQANTFNMTVADPTAAAVEVARRLSMLGA